MNKEIIFSILSIFMGISMIFSFFLQKPGDFNANLFLISALGFPIAILGFVVLFFLFGLSTYQELPLQRKATADKALKALFFVSIGVLKKRSKFINLFFNEFGK